MNWEVEHDQENKRFYVTVDNKVSELKYKDIGRNTLNFFSTRVPSEHRNQGIAGQITAYALQYAKQNNYLVIPTCSFVKKYINEHQEYQQLVTSPSKEKTNSLTLKKYWPLLSLIIISAFSASAINFGVNGGMQIWMHYFMGVFLLIFSTLKIFDPIQFADGFQKYDIIAKKSRTYAYSYPLIELYLGLAYLAFFLPTFTYITTIILLTIGSVGVIQALNKGLDIKCPCMGTVLDVPLSTVTLTEDISMAAMALLLLCFSIF